MSSRGLPSAEALAMAARAFPSPFTLSIRLYQPLNAVFASILRVSGVVTVARSLLQNSAKQLLEILFEIFEDGVTLQ